MSPLARHNPVSPASSKPSSSKNLFLKKFVPQNNFLLEVLIKFMASINQSFQRKTSNNQYKNNHSSQKGFRIGKNKINRHHHQSVYLGK
ncbi:hypothetical protein O181_133828, partial [Austropuccinia psidii MF-1]|nr:hypothetical protein [Austropuccinia psidii MF-1]